MDAFDPRALLAAALLLVVLLVGVGVVAAIVIGVFRRAATRDREVRRPPRRETSIPEPTHSAGMVPLRANVEPQALDLDEDEVSPPVVELPYTRQRYLLTQAERDFFAVLQAAAPKGWYVFPQVRLANLVTLRKGTRNWKFHFSRVAQKCVDFVLCDAADIGPRLVVELDDSSHNRPDRQARDQFVDAALSAAGLPILHVPWRRHYDREQLTRDIATAAGLPAPHIISPLPAPSLVAASQNAVSGYTPPPATRIAASSVPAATPWTRWACRSCGEEVAPAAKFCKSCGATLEL